MASETLEKLKVCPRCGKLFGDEVRKNLKNCDFCGKKLIDTPFPSNTPIPREDSEWRNYFIDIHNSSEFSKDLREQREAEDDKRREAFAEYLRNKYGDKPQPTRPKPKCPYCGSENLKKISGLKKAGKIGLFGIFGAGDIGKTYKCQNCGCKF